MPFNAVFSHIIKRRLPRIENYTSSPISCQLDVLLTLVHRAKQTEFGKTYQFSKIKNFNDFKEVVPLSNYDTLFPLINKQINGEKDILWPGYTTWFAKSSGTTTKTEKLLPITTDSLYENHYAGGKDLLALYYKNYEKRKLYNAKHLIIGGSTQINAQDNNTSIGDLSAFIVENLPWWTEIRRTPKREIALMDNWEEKLDKMARATVDDNICIVAGMPTWTLVLFEKVLEITRKKNIHEVWPNLELYIHGGMNIQPYKARFKKLLPNSKMNYVQSYNSSEGYFGLQDLKNSNEMLLLTNAQILYEFIPMDEFNGLHSQNVVGLKDVKTGVQYALVISTSAGLWRYIIGDTVQFSSIKPYRFMVTGRTTHYINAFGEKTIIAHVEKAIAQASQIHNVEISDFTVGPYFQKLKGSGGHQWVIAVKNQQQINLSDFEESIDKNMKAINGDYKSKRKGDFNMMPPKFNYVKKEDFEHWLKSKNKLGGQHKIPRLQNDRLLIQELLERNHKSTRNH
jgi:hypothetical protein